MTLKRSLFGKEITCDVTVLDEGLSVQLYGGDKSHIGAISVVEPGEETKTTVFPGHKEHYITRPWAEKLAERTGTRVAVLCGIHYEEASPAQIQEIMSLVEKLLEEIMMEI